MARTIIGLDGTVHYIYDFEETETPEARYERRRREELENLFGRLLPFPGRYNLDYGIGRDATLTMGSVQLNGILSTGEPVQLPTIMCAKCKKTPDEMTPLGYKDVRRGRLYCVEVKCHGDCEEMQISELYLSGSRYIPKLPAFGDRL